jgi:hypothetical protein
MSSSLCGRYDSASICALPIASNEFQRWLTQALETPKSEVFAANYTTLPHPPR